jgi:amino acid transporter
VAICGTRLPRRPDWACLRSDRARLSCAHAFVQVNSCGQRGPADYGAAEEVQDASRVNPQATVWTLVLNSITGSIMTVTFAYTIGLIEAATQPQYFFAFIGSFYTATQSHAGATVMTLIITILTFCSAVTNVATTSRQMSA